MTGIFVVAASVEESTGQDVSSYLLFRSCLQEKLGEREKNKTGNLPRNPLLSFHSVGIDLSF